MRERDLDVGICIPVLNEAVGIGALLDELRATLGAGRYSLCIVDDGSTDGTREIVRERAAADPGVTLLCRTKTKPGCRRGGASRAGIAWLLEHTSHAWLCDFDADGANRPSEIAALGEVAISQGADVVIASKYARGSRVEGRPWLRRLASRTYSGALGVLLGGGLSDYSNSFRVYRRSAAELLMQGEPLYDTPTYLVEMLAIWLSRDVRIREMPTVYVERRAGASKVVSADLARGALGAMRVGLRYRRGGYAGASITRGPSGR
jgi:dolichol-phosphate mannosyltransferase